MLHTSLTRKLFVYATVLAASLALHAAPSLARPEIAGQSAADRFNAMDTTKDGKLTREEFFAAQPQMKEAAFVAIDADKDGVMTIQEWENFSKGHAKSDATPGEGGMGSGMPPQGMGGSGMPPQGMGGSGMPPQGMGMPAREAGVTNSTAAPEAQPREKTDLIMPPRGGK